MSSSTVPIYDILYIYLYLHRNELDISPASKMHGLIAHFVDQCIGVAEVMGSNPVQAWILLKFCM